MRQTICLTPSALNEAGALDKFLRHHSWADEIIVIDSGSTDRTEEICKAYGRRTVKHKVDGNYNQRSAWVITQTQADWVFFIDPDEFITPQLKDEIFDILECQNDRYQAYEFRRVNFFMDKRLEHGGRSGYSLKMFYRKAVSFVGDSYHEKPIINGRIGRLKGEVLHYPNPNIHWITEKFNYISEFDSDEYFKDYGVMSPRKFKWLLFKKPFKNFWKSYIKKQGYKDGLHGLIYAMLIWAEDVIRICKYGERYIVKNPYVMAKDRLPDPWECRKRDKKYG